MKANIPVKLTGLAGILCMALSGCEPGTQYGQSSPSGETMTAVAVLEPTQGNQARGTVTFTQTDDGVRVVADITGLKPGEHGFHIHEHGDCSAPDGSSAGGHFNPTGMAHGGPDAAEHHLGDLGNLTADASGKAQLNRVYAFLDLNGTNAIVGRGLVVHSDRDDLTSQPTGNAGKRVACGVIEATR
ncbi:MAG: superoxide dismutase family protein [Verrucomicrobia bacterium]|jgi:Cu-Zn family superoxide dismutase|nr:superoxide dismutase family protein [Verrucomicrobiota bacterium]